MHFLQAFFEALTEYITTPEATQHFKDDLSTIYAPNVELTTCLNGPTCMSETLPRQACYTMQLCNFVCFTYKPNLYVYTTMSPFGHRISIDSNYQNVGDTINRDENLQVSHLLRAYHQGYILLDSHLSHPNHPSAHAVQVPIAGSHRFSR